MNSLRFDASKIIVGSGETLKVSGLRLFFFLLLWLLVMLHIVVLIVFICFIGVGV